MRRERRRHAESGPQFARVPGTMLTEPRAAPKRCEQDSARCGQWTPWFSVRERVASGSRSRDFLLFPYIFSSAALIAAGSSYGQSNSLYATTKIWKSASSTTASELRSAGQPAGIDASAQSRMLYAITKI